MNENGNKKLTCTKIYILLKSVSNANFNIIYEVTKDIYIVSRQNKFT